MMNCLLKVDKTTRDSMNAMNPTDDCDVRFNQFRLLKKSFLTLVIDVSLDDIDLKCNHRKLRMDGHIKPENGAGPFQLTINENEHFARL